MIGCGRSGQISESFGVAQSALRLVEKQTDEQSRAEGGAKQTSGVEGETGSSRSEEPGEKGQRKRADAVSERWVE